MGRALLRGVDEGEKLAKAFLTLLDRNKDNPRKLKDLALMCRHMSDAAHYRQDWGNCRKGVGVAYAKAEIKSLAGWV